MKKNFITALALVLVISLSGPAFAAVNPYSDVPAGHWAYDAVQELSNAGIVDGYSDGTYRGQKNITRYEMAVITANAVTKMSNADAEHKALIEKLVEEFAGELKSQNIRLTELEDKVDKSVKVSGKVRQSYEWDKDYDSKYFTHIDVDLTSQLTDKLVFKGRITSENKAGNGPVATGLGYEIEGSQVINVNHAYIAGTALGFDTFILGRLPFAFGQGLLASSEESGWPRGACEGLVLGDGGNKLKYVVANGRLGLRDHIKYTGNDMYDRVSSSFTLQGYMLTYLANKNTTLYASLITSKDRALYESGAIALNYKGIKNIEISSEYGQNDSDYANLNNGGDAANAWFAKVKYKGADGAKNHSYGLWAAYRQADPFFDPMGIGAGGFVRTTHYLKDGTNNMGFASNIKGYDAGFEMTVFKDAILSLQYGDYENKKGNGKEKNFMTTLEYKF